MEENAVRSHSFNGNKFFAFFCKYIDNQAIALYYWNVNKIINITQVIKSGIPSF